MYTFPLRTRQHTDLVVIDQEIRRIIRESGVVSGVCHIFVPHTTAGITINENADPDVVRDLKQTLERIVPWTGDYAHAEGNSAAHLKASMMGFTQTLLIDQGAPVLGTWQSVYFCEFDGPRTRQVHVQIVPAG